MTQTTITYLGLDPGLAKTGYVVCTNPKNGTIRLEACGMIKTKPKVPLRERYDDIRNQIDAVIDEYQVNKVICEAYEVRTYQGARKSSVAMSKLINEISEQVYMTGRLFLLSSPDIRKYVKSEEIPEDVKAKILELPKYQREHVLDAYVHVMYQIRRNGNGR